MSDRLAAVRAQALATEQGLPFVDLGRRALDADAVRAVPFEALARCGPTGWARPSPA